MSPRSYPDGRVMGPRVARLTVTAVIAGALALPGCGPSPDEVRAEARTSESQVTRLSRDVLGQLTSVGTVDRPEGTWSGCGDLGGRALYEVTGRIAPRPDDVGPLADRVVETLASGGLRLRPIDPQEDDPVILEVVRNDINVQFFGYSSNPLVLFDIIGPCLDVGDLDSELIGTPAEPLRLDER